MIIARTRIAVTVFYPLDERAALLFRAFWRCYPHGVYRRCIPGLHRAPYFCLRYQRGDGWGYQLVMLYLLSLLALS